MINRPIIKFFAHDHGFSLIGLRNFEFNVKEYLEGISGEEIFCDFIDNILNVNMITRHDKNKNIVLGGFLVMKILNDKHFITFSTALASDSVNCICNNVPSGLGEPCFDKFQAVLGREILMLQDAIGFEIGSGFAGSHMRGSQHNDPFVMTNNKILPSSNFAGGVLGGITSGANICFTVTFEQLFEDIENLVKSISAIIILDFLLLQNYRIKSSS